MTEKAEKSVSEMVAEWQKDLPPELTNEQKTIVLAIYSKLDRIANRLHWLIALVAIIIILLIVR